MKVRVMGRKFECLENSIPLHLGKEIDTYEVNRQEWVTDRHVYPRQNGRNMSKLRALIGRKHSDTSEVKLLNYVRK